MTLFFYSGRQSGKTQAMSTLPIPENGLYIGLRYPRNLPSDNRQINQPALTQGERQMSDPERSKLEIKLGEPTAVAADAGLTTPHKDKMLLAVQHAVEGYKAKYPTVSEEEIKDFTEALIERIKSKKRPDHSTYRADRQARRLAVVSKSRELGVSIGVVRVVEMIDEEERSYRLVPTGGLTAAYRYNEVNNTTEVSAAVCSVTDLFDRLEGRERAVERFGKGLTLKYPGKLTDVDPGALQKHYLQFLRDKGISPQQQGATT